MSLTAILLLSISTFSHAFWNLLGKRRHPSGAFFLVASLSAAACLAPFSIFFLRLAALLPPSFWVMLAATGFAVPDVSWLYFALAQFPIYLLPHLLRPLARRLQQVSD